MKFFTYFVRTWRGPCLYFTIETTTSARLWFVKTNILEICLFRRWDMRKQKACFVLFFLTGWFLCVQDLQGLEKQLEVLKSQAPTETGGDDTSLDDRLEKLQQDARLLANTTDNILKSLEGSAHFLTSTTRIRWSQGTWSVNTLQIINTQNMHLWTL